MFHRTWRDTLAANAPGGIRPDAVATHLPQQALKVTFADALV
jgi:hypothetical protein